MVILRSGLISLALFLTACASNTHYQPEHNADSFKGSSINTVVAKWGMPDQTLHARNGNSYYMYNTNAGGFYNSTYAAQNNLASPISMHVAGGGGYNSSYGQMVCSTLFQTNSANIITAVTHKGSNCGGTWVTKPKASS